MKWETRTLGEIADIVSGAGFPHEYQGKKHLRFPFIKVSDMNDAQDGELVRTAANSIDEDTARKLRAKVCPAGTIIFPKVGGALLTNKKRKLGCDAVFDNNIMALVPIHADGDWLFRWMQNFDLRTLANTQALPSIRQSDVEQLKICVPPLPKQKRIAARLREQLAEVEKAREALQSQLEAAEKIHAAALRECFDSDHSAKWQVVPLGTVSEVVSGLQKTPDRAPKKFHRPFLTVRNVQRGRLDLSRIEEFEVTAAELERLKLASGDLLIVEGNGSKEHIGRNALFDQEGEWIHQNHIIRVRLDREQCLPEFISAYLNSSEGKAQMLEKAETTTGLYTLSSSKVASLRVPSPTLALQKQTAARLMTFEETSLAASHEIKSRLEAVEKLPAALLREVFDSAK